MSGFILALDQGTTNTKALAIDGQGRIAARHSAPTPVRYPRLGWVEQSGAEIWSATVEAIEGCLAALPADARLAAVSVANQRESVLLWRRSTGETIGPCVTWQCRRSADRVDALRAPATEEAVVATTGLGLDPLFPAAKISRGRDNRSRRSARVAAGLPGCRPRSPRRSRCARVPSSPLTLRSSQELAFR